ncbi:membrane protein insertion efficiency factor YidD [Cellulosispirillum alkaliphilum]|uniref:membrane protein insertion efficiency factor YidD n=1 Tax=Cellulosispirillum alkaliphilum TaxID=3039283 RepID=UPI003D6F4956
MAPKSKKILANTTYYLIQNFKIVFLMGKGTCRFEPTCSRYAQEAIANLPLYRAIPKIIHRVIKCNPLFKGGYDPVHKPKMKGARK